MSHETICRTCAGFGDVFRNTFDDRTELVPCPSCRNGIEVTNEAFQLEIQCIALEKAIYAMQRRLHAMEKMSQN